MSGEGEAPVLVTRGLTRTLGTGEAANEVLRGIDLEIRRGEFCAIMGPSGSGKSTLMYLLGALDHPTSGKVLVDGTSTTDLPSEGLSRLRNRKLGFIFQFHYLLHEFTALENVMMPMAKAGVPAAEARARAAGLLADFDLSDKANRIPERLSGGEQQRVAIARSLANNPLVILGDEPTGNLDTKNSDRVFAIFERLVRERRQTIVVVTHDPHMASRTDRTIRLVDGRIVDDGPSREVLARAS